MKIYTKVAVLIVILQLQHQYSQASGFKDGQDEKKGCALLPAMTLEHCLRPEEVQQYVDHYYKGVTGRRFYLGRRQHRLREEIQYAGVDTSPKFQAQFDDSKDIKNRDVDFIIPYKEEVAEKVTGARVVQHGAACVIDPISTNPSMFKCGNGIWMAFDTLQMTYQHENGKPSDQPIVRVKRRGEKVSVTKTEKVYGCKNWWFFAYDCGDKEVTSTFENYKPEIKCPEVSSTFYADKQSESTVVTWPRPRADDQEDGYLGVRLVGGTENASGRMNEGKHTFTYAAQDKHGAVAFCEVKFEVVVRRCPELIAPDYGSMRCSHENTYGSECNFICDEGYKMSGYKSSVCLETEKWSHAVPKCLENTCPDQPDVHHGKWKGCERKKVASQCSLVCDTGYKRDGPSHITCQESLTWSELGNCIDVQVPDITCPADKSVLSLPKKQPVSVIWSAPLVTDNSKENVKVLGSKEPGDSFPIGDTLVRYNATDSSNNSASCTMIVTVLEFSCPPLAFLENGETNCSHDMAVGSECFFTCNEGYQVEGPSQISCLESQQWSHSPLPVCKKISCGTPDIIQHGNISCVDDDYLFEATCHVICEEGYTVVGPLVIVCASVNASLQWSESGHCIDSESPEFIQECANIREYAAAGDEETLVTFALPQATDNSGGHVVVTSSPKSGSAFDVGVTNVTVSATDEQGNTGKCTFSVEVIEIRCQDPTNTDLDESDDKLMVFSCPNGHSYGASCEVSCSDGNPVSGPTTIRCEKNGTSVGYWWYGNVKPSCQSELCPLLDPPTYGSIACNMLGGKQICSVQCNRKYSFPKGHLEDGTVYCNPNLGKWLPLKVSKNTCQRGRPANGVELMSDIYYYSSSCSDDNEEVKRNFFEIINDTDMFKDVCGRYNITCRLQDVSITCGGRAKRSTKTGGDQLIGHLNHIFKRSVSDATMVTKAVFVIQIDYVEQEDAATTTDLYRDLAQDINTRYDEGLQEGKYNMPEVGYTDDSSYGFGIPRYQCPEPTLYQHQTAICAGCGPGYIYISQSEPCLQCPVGTYQPELEGTQCLQCPDHYTTLKPGSTSPKDCALQCEAGSYSKKGTEPCDVCQRGSYQPLRGQTLCQLCPYGMSTKSEGAVSESECGFYNIHLTNTTASPVMVINYPVKTFTFMSWINVPSDIVNTETKFTLTQHENAATLGCENSSIYIVVDENPVRMRKKQWYHLAAVYNDGVFYLYVDGKEVQQKSLPIPCGEPRLQFTPSSQLQALTISEMQTSLVALSADQISPFASQCGAKLDDNILFPAEIDESLVTPSTCDAQDSCTEDPCGGHGACIDLQDTYRCLCLNFWSGDNCEIPPNYCEVSLCSNGATCVSHAEDGNFTCLCPEDYTGVFCKDKVVHGGWSRWSDYSPCTASCGGGTMSRIRTCDNPPPNVFGLPCEGSSQEITECSTFTCPVDGGVSEWTDWEECSASCGGGLARRYRTCSNPPPAHGGKVCIENLEDVTECKLDPCPIGGGFGDWSEWSACSASCGGGQSRRTRECNNPVPKYGGADCSSELGSEVVDCNDFTCPMCPLLQSHDKNVFEIFCNFSSVLNDDYDMTECMILCKKGYMADYQATLVCGRLTNYVWSHVNKDNPRGLLARCSKVDIPKRRMVTYSANFKGTIKIPSESLREAVMENLDRTIPCKTCTYKVRTTMDDNRTKRSADSVTVFVTMEVTNPFPGLDMENATDDEIKEQLENLYEFETTSSAILNNTEEIFTVNIENKTYHADTESIEVTVDMQCLEGTYMSSGVCVDCGPGTYWVDGDCQLCPEGHYQEQARATACDKCPPDTSTAGRGAQSKNDCVEDPSIYFPTRVGFWDEDPIGEEKDSGNASHDNCTEDLCGDHGTCIDLEDNHKCVCLNSWSGDNCEIPPNYCEIQPCNDGATCVNHPEDEDFSCLCPADYTGKLCENKIGQPCRSSSPVALYSCAVHMLQYVLTLWYHQ